MARRYCVTVAKVVRWIRSGDLPAENVAIATTGNARPRYRIDQTDLAAFEQKYHLSSTEFYQQFQAGQTGDDMDYVEWASLVQMADNLKKRLRLLTGEADA